jgi:hypothetical protein
MLCSFSKNYDEKNWEAISRDLKTAIWEEMELDKNLTEAQRTHKPDLLRTRDMHSPRLVSQALLEAILRTDFCVIDWSEWRPSVFFELGVRLAVNELDPVSILETGARAKIRELAEGTGDPRPAHQQADRLQAIAVQCDGLRVLFDPLDYPCDAANDPTLPYRRMVQRHNRLKDKAASSSFVPNMGTLPPRFTYQAVWNMIDPRGEPVSDPVEQFLRHHADPLLIDPTEGRAPFVYPKNHDLTRKSEESGRERLLAAWLYLHHRIGPERLRVETERAECYCNLGWQVLSLLRDCQEPADQAQAAWIESQLKEFEGSL